MANAAPGSRPGPARMMCVTFANFRTDDVHGSTLADYLSGVEADLRILAGTTVVYEEPSFPVCELARDLGHWVTDGAGEDFVFESMSFEEPGVVTIERRGEGWVCRSSLTPEIETSVTPLSEVTRAIEAFVATLRAALVTAGIDADFVIGPDS
jgi:hypothetical protein